MSFRFEKLTTKAQQAIAYAQNKASVMGHPEITPLHLMTSLLEETDGIVAPLLEKIDAPAKQLIEWLNPKSNGFPAQQARTNRISVENYKRFSTPLRRSLKTCRTNLFPPNTCCWGS